MKKIFLILVLGLSVLSVPGFRAESAETAKDRKILYYRNPMGQPDTSPVPKKDSMGMDYIPVYEGEQGQASQIPSHATIRIPEEKQQLMGVKMGTVEKRKLTKKIRTGGYVGSDNLLNPSFMQDSGRLRPIRNENLNIYGALYEYDLPFVKKGNLVKVRIPTFGDRELMGKVRAILPVYDYDQRTRTFRVKVQVKNPAKDLYPQTSVDIEIEADLGEALALPEEAVIQTGERAIVFIAKGDGVFEPREVKLGVKAENFYEVKSGVKPGETVALGANFLIDSESRLQAVFEGMSKESETNSHDS